MLHAQCFDPERLVNLVIDTLNTITVRDAYSHIAEYMEKQNSIYWLKCHECKVFAPDVKLYKLTAKNVENIIYHVFCDECKARENVSAKYVLRYGAMFKLEEYDADPQTG